MQRPPADDPLLLPEREAVRRHADERNATALWRLATVAGVAAAGGAFFFFLVKRNLPMVLLVADVALLLGLWLGRESALLKPRTGALCAGFLLFQYGLLLTLLWGFTPGLKILLSGVLLPLLVLAFRLERWGYLLVLGSLWAVTVWVWQMETEGLWRAPGGFGGLIWPTLFLASLYGGAVHLAASRRRRFLDDWRERASRERERERIREEIEDARQIQLSMLPRTTPRLPWLDIASVSLPASEVGGDYFDYFELPGAGLSVVVGDVAGHGMASGLMLASLKSGLYLLRDDLPKPVEVLNRLNRMVQHTATRRMLVTLLCATLDPESRTATVANAGHPPALHYSAAGGEVTPLDLPALPLGTHLPAVYRQETVSLSPGDALLLYTDGLLEMASGSGSMYGEDRLARTVSSLIDGRAAREIRNSILADLSNFKGDARRQDDVTLIVIKVT